MAEEPQVIRGISWREVFPFTHIFRAFRIAIHPSKLMLGLMAILVLYGGGRVLDALWANKSSAVRGEIERVYLRENAAQPFSDARDQVRTADANRVADYLATRGEPAGKFNTLQERLLDDPSWAYGKAKYWAQKDLQASVKAADEQYNKDKESKDDNVRKDAPKMRGERYQAAYKAASARISDAKDLKGIGLFDTFLRYQVSQVNVIWNGVLGNNWLGGMPSSPGTDGVVKGVINFFTVAPGWASQYHFVYFLLYGALFLVTWSLFAGAIARIAAVHAADEGRKLSIRQGLSFAFSKFLSFISAPLIPALIIVVIGLVLAVAGLVLFGIPGFSAVVQIAGSLLFFLALAAGFVMTLVLMGAIGGFNLMYPTIAVEGSDSFDAISRSFSYVYARPWRMLWYTLVAIAYGALTYLFVRLFIFFILLLTHTAVGLFVFRDALNGQQVFEVMWPTPTWQSLTYPVNAIAMGGWTSTNAYIIAIWVYLVVALLGAFAISFYVSASTLIYYLMRREVDATEMDDVYLEQPEEEFGEAAQPPAAPAAETAAAPAVETAAAPATTQPTSPAPVSQDPPANPPTA